ncbi:GNAT family N-acetyltransferase [Bacillus licheniformis]|uniref:GNAT family N-acetyltransferase n=1 Tax=Bacillus licheniformis TaxID=1402 RepID=UPI00137FA07B|nr:hypothetical protein CHCC20487_1608 [Bacillus licheniformis]
MKDMIMKTDRLILRKMRRDDAENLLEIFSDPIAMEYYPSTKNEKQTFGKTAMQPKQHQHANNMDLSHFI